MVGHHFHFILIRSVVAQSARSTSVEYRRPRSSNHAYERPGTGASAYRVPAPSIAQRHVSRLLFAFCAPSCGNRPVPQKIDAQIGANHRKSVQLTANPAPPRHPKPLVTATQRSRTPNPAVSHSIPPNDTSSHACPFPASGIKDQVSAIMPNSNLRLQKSNPVQASPTQSNMHFSLFYPITL
jgi:hypothetical protein